MSGQLFEAVSPTAIRQAERDRIARWFEARAARMRRSIERFPEHPLVPAAEELEAIYSNNARAIREMGDEVPPSPPCPPQWCGICQQEVTFDQAAACRSVVCPKFRG